MTARIRVLADFAAMVAHRLFAPSKPQIAKSIRAGCVIPQIGIAESAEGMKPTAFDPERFQNRVQTSAQDVALAKRFSSAGMEDESILAVADEIGQQLRNIRVEVNGAVGVGRFRCLNLALPSRLFDLQAVTVEVPNVKPKQLTRPETRRCKLEVRKQKLSKAKFDSSR
jgi:hypothetical protein